jgi:hypothetical protein
MARIVLENSERKKRAREACNAVDFREAMEQDERWGGAKACRYV